MFYFPCKFTLYQRNTDKEIHTKELSNYVLLTFQFSILKWMNKICYNKLLRWQNKGIRNSIKKKIGKIW